MRGLMWLIVLLGIVHSGCPSTGDGRDAPAALGTKTQEIVETSEPRAAAAPRAAGKRRAPSEAPAATALTPTPANASLNWGGVTRLDNSAYRVGRTAPGGGGLVVDDGSVHAVWQSVMSKTNSEVFYRRSDDGGRTWASEVRLSNSEGRANSPRITAEGEQVHVVWKDKRFDDNGEIFYSRSLDRGKTWSDAKRMTDDEFRSSAIQVVVHGDTVLISWEDYSMNNKRSDVELLRSTDRGATWSARESLAPAVNGCPVLVVDPAGVVHASLCSWDHAKETNGYNYEIYYRRSKDGGVTWEPRVRLTDDQVGDSRFPIVAEGNGVVHIVWWDDRDDTTQKHNGYPGIEPQTDHNFEVYYKRSTDGGDTWEPDVRLTKDEAVGADPALTALGDNVYVTWQDDRDGNFEIYFKISHDRGATWADDARLTTGSATSKLPSLDVDADGNIYLMWSEYTSKGNAQVNFIKGTAS